MPKINLKDKLKAIEVFRMLKNQQTSKLKLTDLRKALAFMHISPINDELEDIVKLFKAEDGISEETFLEIVKRLYSRKDDFENIKLSLQMLAEDEEFINIEKLQRVLKNSTDTFNSSDLSKIISQLNLDSNGNIRITDLVTLFIEY